MASPSMVQRSGDTLIVRSVVSGDRLFLDPSECTNGESVPSAATFTEPADCESPIIDDYVEESDIVDLPQCKIKRNYDCSECNYFTQNPRHYLAHLRDVHGEKVKIYYCPNCLYASRHFQKLLRHMKMVHGAYKAIDATTASRKKPKESSLPMDVEKPEKQEDDQSTKPTVDAKAEEKLVVKKSKTELKCTTCDFTATSFTVLTKHERKEHLKTKYFPCSKCNYATHIKARFTKHVKYHSMPMIKCEVCDFRTPYKWNLDRHMKNHGGAGAFCCSACNFTADIKQSLTVHEMNHHVPAVGTGNVTTGGGGPIRRRNRVGATDTSSPQTTRPRRRRARHRPIQPTSIFQEDVSTNDHNENTNISISQNSTNCDDSLVDSSEVEDTKISIHAVNSCTDSQDGNDDNSVLKMEWTNCEIRKDDNALKVQTKKTPRPIPNLIPLHMQNSGPINKNVNLNSLPLNLSVISKNSDSSAHGNKSPTYLKAHYSEIERNDIHCNDDSVDLSQFDRLSAKSDESSQHSLPRIVKTIGKKKTGSIFDKLYKEKLNAAFENGTFSNKNEENIAKHLQNHSFNEKNSNTEDIKLSQINISSSGLSSTRCQHCRHRCKSSLDLVVHLQTCLLTNKNQESSRTTSNEEQQHVPVHPISEGEVSADDPQLPHPMENVVFVWNPIMNNNMAPTTTTVENFDTTVDNSKVATSTPNNNNNITSNEYDNTNTGKKVFKCPHCSFWASTASRFHVHIVGHLNKKPFECSLCSYKSNWRWDITKHIRLKSVRDPEHAKAKVLMTDETGRRNYSKYNKYLTLMQITDSSVDVASASLNLFNRKNKGNCGNTTSFDNVSSVHSESLEENASNSSFELRTQNSMFLDEHKNSVTEEKTDNKKSRKSMWKCKKCDYRNASKDALLMHVRKHSKTSTSQPYNEEPIEEPPAPEVANTSDISSISYRCGHCNQVSNWKHVIQRHCRLKHNGDVKVVVCSKSAPVAKNSNTSQNVLAYMKCSKCPFTAVSKSLYESHLKQHTVTAESTFKCFICPFYVKTEAQLMQHLPLHGLTDPEKYSSQIQNCKSSVLENVPIKRYRCSDCPYESNSKSQFTYHEQFHKANDAPFKCDVCNYQVSKRHLLHQHMKVHGFNLSHKDVVESTNNTTTDITPHVELSISLLPNRNKNDSDLVQMWVSFSGEFQKMYKCRSCPYVNLRKNNVLEHEKLHNMFVMEGDEQNAHKCTECNFACNNIDTYLSHAKVHKEDYVKVFCPVNFLKTDEQQLVELKEIMSELNLYKYKPDAINFNKSDCKDNETNEINSENKQMSKCIYFCSDCPARFLFEKELQIHYKFHCIRLPYQCSICSYTARQHAHLLAHKNVHFEDYQEKTKALQKMHSTHPEHPQPKVVAVLTFVNESEPVWIVVSDSIKKPTLSDSETIDSNLNENISGAKQSKQHLCTQCPAKFFKSAALNYHLTLHGGEGNFKCRQCNYAVKTIGNLAKHEAVHGNMDNQMDYESSEETNYKNIPLSGTDLYQHKTKAEKRALSQKLVTRPNDHFPPVLQADPQFGLLMHGNPDFIYPTYLKNGRPKEKRYKCHKCPSAFEKREQYKVHLSLHGSRQRYKCEICDYSVKYYANYVQHMRKHQMNADAQAARQGVSKKSESEEFSFQNISDTKLAIKSLPKQPHKDCSKLSISDQQTLKLLHRRRSSAASIKDVVDDKKIYRCTYCPYTNQRRDALDNHMRRHSSVSSVSSNFTCNYCDYAAPQSQFLRDHMKVHFHSPKHITPECFTNFEGLKILISKINNIDPNSSNTDYKETIFNMKNDVDNNLNDKIENKLYVIPTTGERVI